MAIIQYAKKDHPYYEFLTAFPDQYVSQKEKESEDWWQLNMDFFSIQAYRQFIQAKETFVKNYRLVKGELTKEDFYEEEQVVSFLETLKINELPEHVKNYSIMMPVLNTLKGELSKRPDGFRVKAMDADSKSQEFQFRTQVLLQYCLQIAQQRIFENLTSQGIEPSEIPIEEVQQQAFEEVSRQIENYSSTAEEWGNLMLEALKVVFNMKEISEDCFNDLLHSGRENYHIIETNENSLGFKVVCENPKNTWKMTTPDKKYRKHDFANGTIHVMEMSQILDEFPWLTEKEIKHLRKYSEQFAPFGAQESNLNKSITGQDSITYNTYDPLIEQMREYMTAALDVDGINPLDDIFGLTQNNASFGNKFAVVRAYWKSKIKVGKLTLQYPDMPEPVIELVDENYKNNSHPYQVDKIEWQWANQWYYGVKIGPDIYHVEPFKLLPYSPIIGVSFEAKNSEVKALVDLMKPFQMIYNVPTNQLWKILEKEFGVVYEVEIRKLVTPKDGDDQDALDMAVTMAKEEGVLLTDSSPENMKAPIPNTSVAKAVDLSRSNEMQSRILIAQWAKAECYALVGMTPERQGSVAATQTATGVNASLTQSYAQTEPYFVQHEYVLNDVYQALLDAAQYIESQKPTSTISYITPEGTSAFLQVAGHETLGDLKVFATNRQKDQEAFQALKSLAQAALQNGASLYDIAELYTTDSIRKTKFVFKQLKEKQDQIVAQQQQIEQQQLQMQQEQFQAQVQINEQARQEAMINDNYQKELDRLLERELALIDAASREGSQVQRDADGNGVPDILEISKFAAEQSNAALDRGIELQRISTEKTKLMQDRDMQLNELKMKSRELDVKEKEIKSKEKIATVNRNKYSKGNSKTKK